MKLKQTEETDHSPSVGEVGCGKLLVEKDIEYCARDSDGSIVKAGAYITFSYGIPSIKVVGKVVSRRGVLKVLTPTESNKECLLSLLKGYVGEYWLCDQGGNLIYS